MFLPINGTVDKNIIHTYLWARAAEGATRASVISEIKHWRELLLEVGDAIWPTPWVELKINRLFPVR